MSIAKCVNLSQEIKGLAITNKIETVFTDGMGHFGLLVKCFDGDGDLSGVLYAEDVGNSATFTDLCSGDTEQGELKISLDKLLDLIKERPDDWQVDSVMA